MGWEIDRFRPFVVAAAAEVRGREKDGSFLERTLRDALAQHLPGKVATEQPLGLPSWSPGLGGVDIICDPQGRGEPIGIETKVWDVEDALFDLLKLAAGTQQAVLKMGYSVIAARPRDWQRRGVVSMMSCDAHPACLSTTWVTADVLTVEAKDWGRIWQRSSARPQAPPALLAVFTTTPVGMPHAPGHEVRIIGVCSVNDRQIGIDDDGRPTRAWGSEADPHREEDPDALFASVEAGIQQARSRPPGAIFYSDMDPAEKITALQALLAERADLESEIAGYISAAIRQQDA
jgi:hypothetical protein